MAGSIVSSPHGAEISERSNELVLPGHGNREHVAPMRGREIGVSEPRTTSQPAAQSSRSSDADGASTSGARSESPRGLGLPGDRGPRNQEAESQRPSFWRRIALGRRSTAEPATPTPPPAASSAQGATTPPSASLGGTLHSRGEPLNGAAVVTIDNDLAQARGRGAAPIETLEKKIVEPMLQALVSVEAKLERSHTELVGRSDQVEQRLTQLWDIEEQLGTLGELQESLLQVSEQQRRLESAVVSQTRTLRWLVGAVFVSLAGAAFVVALFLR